MMRNGNLFLLLMLMVIIWGCQKEEEVETTGVVKGTITDALTATELAGVKLLIFESNTHTPVYSVTTAADGSYRAELEPGSYYVKLYHQGYEQVPPRNITPVPFTVVLSEELENPVEMYASAVQNGGYIQGKISEAGKGVAGALVVGENAGKAYSTTSDAEGNFYLYNLPAASYQVKGWIAGYESEQKTVSVAAATESKQDILLTQGAAGAVQGTISFLATTAVEVDVTLTHPLTHEPITGLSASTMAAYAIKDVPKGIYLARATYRNDGRVVDPDWIVKFGEPMVEVSGGQVTRDFSLTNSLSIKEPTNVATTTLPTEITSATPTFSWTPYSSASDYAIEVSDASGQVIWGGIDMSQTIPVKKVIVPGSQTSVVFNADGSATKAMEPGKVYRWKVYASKDDKQAASGWRLISVSEDQIGLIKIAK